MREVMKNPPSKTFQKYILTPLMEKSADKEFTYFNQINKAHLMMLTEEDIVTKDTAKKIFTAIKDVEKNGIEKLDLDSTKEDLSSVIEAYIISQCSADIGGQLHTGRSRNDMGGTVTRMSIRSAFFTCCDQINQLRDTMMKIAKEHTETVCTGYTCAQPAEPTTIAYYFTAYLTALERDFQRLKDSYKRLNQCPLGSCSMAGTSFPINRASVSYYLGFNQETPNALDGIAARDYVLEFLSDLSVLGINLSRFCQDMYVWVMQEISFADIDSSVAMCSSIMPQKKNPVIFEHVKGKAGHLLGAYVSAAGALKSTPYTQVRDSSIESASMVYDTVKEIECICQVLIDTLNTMKFHKERLEILASENFSTVSELANVLVKDYGISFRQAHSIVGKAVAIILEHDQKPTDITCKMIEDLAIEICGKKLDISEASLSEALDPRHNAFSRHSTGGPAPEQVIQQLKMLENTLETDGLWLVTQKNAILDKEKELDRKIDVLLK